MNAIPGRMLTLILTLLLITAACSVDVGDDSAEQPTPFVITSTPTDEASSATPTPGDASTATIEATTSPETSPTPSADAPTPTADATRGPSDPARAEIEAIEADVVDLRGLELLDDLDEQIIDRDELARRVSEIIAEEYTPEEARVDALTYWLLRLIPDRDLDLYQLQIDLLSEQIAGYYDPETKELVVVTDQGDLGVTDKVTMAHEIVHALQDQHFDLIAIDEFAIDADHDAAITALIEGDATLSMTDYMLGYLDPLELIELLGETFTGADSGVLDDAPRYIADGLLFSYDSGQVFATALFDEGGYAAIDAAFSDPPSSTEQILHPEKYIDPDRDEPILVDNPDISRDLGDDWQLLRGDVLGEWDLRIMLEDNGVGAARAATASEGWGGSWFDIYESDSGVISLLTTRWDTNDDADQFAEALMRTFSNDSGVGSIWTEDERTFSVIASDDTVVIISGTDSDAVSRVHALVDQSA